MEDLIIQTVTTAASISGAAAWIAAVINPKYVPLLSGIINLIGANFGNAKNK
jgi:hypothetical protein